MLSNMNELVNSSETADDGVFPDLDMSGQGNSIDNNHIVSDDAIMSDVSRSHNETIVSDYRFTVGLGAAIDRGAFPDGHIVSDDRE
jgi:hypothetical protein